MTPHVCSVARRSCLRVVILRRARHWVDFGLTANPTTYLGVRKIAMRQGHLCPWPHGDLYAQRVARSAASWVEDLLEVGDQPSQEGGICQDLEQDCKEASQHFRYPFCLN